MRLTRGLGVPTAMHYLCCGLISSWRQGDHHLEGENFDNRAIGAQLEGISNGGVHIGIARRHHLCSQ
jgi:hypothetical protein